MLTETVVEPGLDVPYSDTEYPQEVLDRWDREGEIMKLRIETSELKPKTLQEAAAEHGIKLRK